jgi:hypothetical protein
MVSGSVVQVSVPFCTLVPELLFGNESETRPELGRINSPG